MHRKSSFWQLSVQNEDISVSVYVSAYAIIRVTDVLLPNRHQDIICKYYARPIVDIVA